MKEQCSTSSKSVDPFMKQMKYLMWIKSIPFAQEISDIQFQRKKEKKNE